MTDQRIILDGSSREVRAYLAAIVGPSRRPFGAVRREPLQAGVGVVASRATGETVLFVSVEVAANAVLAFSRNNSPAVNQDITVSMITSDPTTFVDVVLMPGEELNVVSSVNTTIILTEVPF